MEPTNDLSLFEQMMMYFHRALDAFAESLRFEKLSRIAFEAASFNLGHAGECANQLSKGFKKGIGEIHWKKLVRTRHILFHDYHKVNPEEIRTILSHNLPHLLKHFEGILKAKKEEM